MLDSALHSELAGLQVAIVETWQWGYLRSPTRVGRRVCTASGGMNVRGLSVSGWCFFAVGLHGSMSLVSVQYAGVDPLSDTQRPCLCLCLGFWRG